MLKEQAKILQKVDMLTDLLVVFASFMLAYRIRQEWGGLNDFDHYLWVLLIALPTWHVLLRYFDLYKSLRITPPWKIFSSLVKVHIICGIITSSFLYLFEPQGYSRGLFLIFVILSLLFMNVKKAFVKEALGVVRTKGFNSRNILIVGTDEKAREFVDLMEQHADWGFKVLGYIHPEGEQALPRIAGYKVLGSTDDLVDICRTNPVDEVVFCTKSHLAPAMGDHLRDMEEMGITVRMILDVTDSFNTRKELSLLHGTIPIMTYYAKPFDDNQLFLKRCLDLVGALIGLCISGLLFPLIAIAIKIDSAGPIFFSQERVRANGRVFKIWKFRSMYVDAESRKKELMARNEVKGAMFKIKDDPRITRIGSFLRAFSLDELPQFWNVLKGDMSLVGTRPPTSDEVVNYEKWHHRRISINPGITGLWQVSGRNGIQDFDEIVRLDLQYIDRWSLWLDIKILFKTLWVVLTRKGSS